MIASVTKPVTRRSVMAALATFTAMRPMAGKSHISRGRVSAITDEIGKTQADAVAMIQQYKLQWVELRRVPGTAKEFAALTAPELKRAAAELGAAKIKVAVLHASTLKPEAIMAGEILGASKLLVIQADADGIAKNLAAVEAAKMQLLVSDVKLLSQFPSKAVGLDWDPVKAPDDYEKSRVANLRVRIGEEAGWRRRMEALDRDGYAGGISLETSLEKSDDGLHDLLRLIDSL